MPRRSDAAIARNRESMRERQRNRPEAAKRKANEEFQRRENLARPFIGWDGEGENYFTVTSDGTCRVRHRYILFGNSLHNYISGKGLATEDCLNLIIQTEQEFPDAFHVIFAGEYDVNMILKDIEWRHFFILKTYNRVRWRGFRIEHIPHKRFVISKNGVTATIFDTFGFFHARYITALEKFKIGTEAQREKIKAGKELRGQFNWSNFNFILEYWKEEIGLFPLLMDEVRELCYDAGLLITQWHGPGALASYMLRVNGISKWMSDESMVPVEVKLARQYAFAGGLFMSWLCGLWDDDAWMYDVNSAYLYAASLMPRLDNGKWQRTDARTIDENCPLFGLYHLRYDGGRQPHRRADQQIHPLFYRDKRGELTWPERVEGWYWGPEARNAIATGKCKVLEAWVYQDDGTKPFEIVHEYFRRRRVLQQAGNPAEKTIKWGLAAWYGQFSRRVGWDKKRRLAPRSHQIEWAGFMTSYTRAMVFKAASYAADRGGLVSIDTDGVTCTVEIPERILENGIGKDLGQWSAEKHSGLLHWQNGIYWLRNGETWESAKARGVPRGRIRADDAFAAYSQIEIPFTPRVQKRSPDACGVIKTNVTRFYGYRQALAQRNYDDCRDWQTEKRRIVMGGTGKSVHKPFNCHACRRPEDKVMHSVRPLPVRHYMSGKDVHTIAEGVIPMSHPHRLPWLEDVKSPVTDLTDIRDIYQDLDLRDDL